MWSEQGLGCSSGSSFYYPIGLSAAPRLMPKRPAEYDVIIGQLLLTDFTVAKVMLSAILLGMAGVFIMRWAGIIRLQIKPGSIGSTVLGGIVFGVGFAILGYCPGTAADAFGSGAMDALMGMIGIVIGAGVFARLYPFLYRRILHWGAFPADTLAELVGLRPEIVALDWRPY